MYEFAQVYICEHTSVSINLQVGKYFLIFA